VIRVSKGDVLESGAQTLVNTVNCVGVMGKGVALRFKERFPDMFRDYLGRCQRGEVALGRPYLYKRAKFPWILNFPTKYHWRSVSRVDDIVQGLEYLVQHYKEWGITSLAIPPLGCGQGKLYWEDVGPILYQYLSRLDLPVEMYAPFDAPQRQLRREFLARVTHEAAPASHRLNPAWLALVEILQRVEREPYHWAIGRVMFQKLAYVATEEGLPTGLRFQRGSYGPFSAELKSLLTKLVNGGFVQEEPRGSRMLAVKVGPRFERERSDYIGYLRDWEPKIEKVADLFMRIRGTRQSELVATVLFSAKSLMKAKGTIPSESDVLTEVLKWKLRRKPPLDKAEVADSIRNLAALDWLNVKPSADLPVPEDSLVGG
jgi:O-acetyl-ADP-ribose deacetylase (regulator of RNase III)/uncharacterized protein YwgA